VEILTIKKSGIFQCMAESYLRGIETPFKKTKSAEVYQRNLGNKSYFIKRYNYSRSLKEVLVDIKNNRKKSAQNDYEVSKKLKELGIPAIEFIGFYSCKKWKDENSILISPDYREEGWYHPTDEALKREGVTSYEIRKILINLMKDFVRLANLNIYIWMIYTRKTFYLETESSSI